MLENECELMINLCMNYLENEKKRSLHFMVTVICSIYSKKVLGALFTKKNRIIIKYVVVFLNWELDSGFK